MEKFSQLADENGHVLLPATWPICGSKLGYYRIIPTQQLKKKIQFKVIMNTNTDKMAMQSRD